MIKHKFKINCIKCNKPIEVVCDPEYGPNLLCPKCKYYFPFQESRATRIKSNARSREEIIR